MAIQDKRGKRFIEDYRLYDLEERELYRKLPHLHKWWNKLYLAETMGYQCGPGATEIPETKEYVIRPIYNLGGMGICTTIKILEKGDISSVPPGYFWCEYFEGNHYSATVTSAQFSGKSKIEQHKMVYNSLKGKMGNELHALAIKTKEQ